MTDEGLQNRMNTDNNILSFSEFVNEQVEWQLLNEFSLSRLWQHINETPLAFISASRGTLTARQNYEREQQLKVAIRSSGFGYVRINGHYIEDHDGQRLVVSEHSFIVIGDKDDEGRLKAFALRTGEQFDQDSILYKAAGVDQHAILIGTTRRNSWLSYGATQDVGVFHPSRVGDFYSQYKNKTFVFDNVSEQTNLAVRAAHRKYLTF